MEYGRFVILGNHRDAWTFGAVDPNSGTAALIEVGDFETCRASHVLAEVRDSFLFRQ